MARIVCICKYPPLEGGIAAKTFWLCRALTERGHTVHVVTDSEDIDAGYCSLGPDVDNSQNNIYVHRPQEKIPWHIPNAPHRDLALLNTTLEVIDRYGADIIDTGYLIPYGLVGCLAGQITKVPFLLRHGGSDLNKFVEKGIWRNLIMKAFKNTASVITDQEHLMKLFELSKNVVAIPPYVPNPYFFKPGTVEKVKPTLALIGKANYYWRHKGWHRAIEIMRALGDSFHFLVVSQGIGLTDFKSYVEQHLKFPIEWRGFVHPMEMPQLIRSVSGIFALQRDLPFLAFSNLVMEAMYSNVTVITDKPDMIQGLREHGLFIDSESRNVLVIQDDDPDKAAETITNYFKQPVPEQVEISQREFDYTAYIQKNEETILSVIAIK
jgi:glycosyltransferase involved in cell wall biosynthesis